MKRKLEGTAFRDRVGNVFFIDGDTLDKARVKNAETARTLSERIDENAEEQPVAIEAGLGFTAVTVDAPSKEAVLRDRLPDDGVVRIERWTAPNGGSVMLW